MEENQTEFVPETEDQGLAGDGVAKLKRCREELKRCQGEKRDYLDTAQRLRADYLNLQKQMTEIRAEAGRAAENKLLIEFLVLADSFEAALEHEARADLPAAWFDGFKQLHGHLKTLLSRLGVEEIPALGETFDPNLHAAFETVAATDQEEDQKIVGVRQTGYRRSGIILRPAGVKIAIFKN